MAFGSAHNLYAREMKFENHRKLRHAGRPSRLASAYLWDTLADARWYQREVLKDDLVYEVKYDGSLPIFRAYHLCIPPHPLYSEDETIRRYWDGSDAVRWANDTSIVPVEVLTLSPLKIQGHVSL